LLDAPPEFVQLNVTFGGSISIAPLAGLGFVAKPGPAIPVSKYYPIMENIINNTYIVKRIPIESNFE